DGRQLALGVELFQQVPDWVAALLVGVGLEERPFGSEVADVAVSGIADGAEAEDRLVAPVAGAEDVLPWRLGAIAEEDSPLHTLRLGYAGDGQERRREVDGLDQAVVHRAGP